MFDFFGSKRVPTLGSGTGVPAPSIASRKELRLILLGLLAVVGVALSQGRGCSTAPGSAMVPEATLQPMQAPVLAGLPALPAPVAVDEQRAMIIEMLRDGHQPSLLTGLDAAILAWAEALEVHDAAQPPLPQRVVAEDFGRHLVQPGQALLTSGRLEDIAPAAVDGGAGGWRWLSLALADGQYALALARDDGELVLNQQIDVVGRFLGRLDAPTEQGSQEMPLIAARQVTKARVNRGDDIPEGMRDFYGPLRLPDDLYGDVDDERPLIETRAYYFTVGQVKTEGASPELYAAGFDANRIANDIHQRPDEFRGRIGTVRGVVYHAWEDGQIAADQPFDVRRVARVLLFKRDIGPITEDGVTRTKSVLRLFEIAVVGDQPLPRAGDYVEATGRFIKWRAIKVDRDRQEDRATNFAGGAGKVYSMFFVVPSYRSVEVQTVNWMPVKIVISVLAGLFFIGMLAYLHRDRGAERRMRQSVALLRETRRKADLRRQQKGQSTHPPAAAGDPGVQRDPDPSAGPAQEGPPTRSDDQSTP